MYWNFKNEILKIDLELFMVDLKYDSWNYFNVSKFDLNFRNDHFTLEFVWKIVFFCISFAILFGHNLSIYYSYLSIYLRNYNITWPLFIFKLLINREFLKYLVIFVLKLWKWNFKNKFRVTSWSAQNVTVETILTFQNLPQI